MSCSFCLLGGSLCCIILNSSWKIRVLFPTWLAPQPWKSLPSPSRRASLMQGGGASHVPGAKGLIELGLHIAQRHFGTTQPGDGRGRGTFWMGWQSHRGGGFGVLACLLTGYWVRAQGCKLGLLLSKQMGLTATDIPHPLKRGCFHTAFSRARLSGCACSLISLAFACLSMMQVTEVMKPFQLLLGF